MKRSITQVRQIFIILIVLVTSTEIKAQVSRDSGLYETLKSKDSLLFEVGFNHCNLKVIEGLLPDRFEFYHDKDGIITSKEGFINTLRENLCSTGQNITQRVLDQGSLEVYPLYEESRLYGAIQMGIHQFGGVTARFMHLWLKEEGEWMPSRMMSYDHVAGGAPKVTDVEFILLSLAEMSVYLGAYEFSPDFTLSIVQEGGILYGDAQGQKVKINPYGDHKFLDESQTMNLNFVVDPAGRVTGLEMEGPEGKMVAQKIN